MKPIPTGLPGLLKVLKINSHNLYKYFQLDDGLDNLAISGAEQFKIHNP